jgi:hypothetical protein
MGQRYLNKAASCLTLEACGPPCVTPKPRLLLPVFHRPCSARSLGPSAKTIRVLSKAKDPCLHTVQHWPVKNLLRSWNLVSQTTYKVGLCNFVNDSCPGQHGHKHDRQKLCVAWRYRPHGGKIQPDGRSKPLIRCALAVVPILYHARPQTCILASKAIGPPLAWRLKCACTYAEVHKTIAVLKN